MRGSVGNDIGVFDATTRSKRRRHVGNARLDGPLREVHAVGDLGSVEIGRDELRDGQLGSGEAVSAGAG